MLALATDYDCWHETEEDVTVEVVMAVLKANAALANAIVKTVASMLPQHSSSPALHAARHAIMTNPAVIPAATKQRLALLYGAYLGL